MTREFFFKNFTSFLPSLDRVTIDTFSSVDFIIISPWKGLITKEVNGLELVTNKLQAISLIPTFRENIKANLSTNAVLDLGEISGKIALDSLNLGRT